MSFNNLIGMCCGAEEETKNGAFIVVPKDMVAEDEDLDRIQRIEETVTLMNRSHRSQLHQQRQRRNEPKAAHFSTPVASSIRGNIACKPMDMSDYCSTHQPPIYEKTDAEMDFLSQVLQDSLMIVLDLADSEIQLLCQAMQKETVEPGTIIIQKGDIGDFYYIVDAGEVLFVDPDQEDMDADMGRVGRGEAFGELALLYDAPRAISCIAADEPVTLWKVDQMTFRYLLAQHYQTAARPLKDRIKQIELFKDLEESVVTKFVQNMTRIHWKAGDQIFVKNEVGNVFYIIEQGQVELSDIGLGDSMFDDQILSAGEAFGERALLTGEPRAANATALTDVTTHAMDRETLERSIGTLQSVLERHLRRQYLATLPLFAQLTAAEIDQLVDLMVEVCYRKDEKLAEAGKPYEPFLWIIRHGRLLVFSTEDPSKIYNLGSGDHFGDKSIRYPGTISTHNAVCEEDLTAWILTKDDIEGVAWDIERLGEPSPFLMSTQAHPMMLDDLVKVKILGHGAFGKVWLVRSSTDKDDASIFALKVISKRLIIDSKQVQGVTREKQLLSLLHHQFIVHLVSSFQDAKNLYLVLPVVPGGELYSVLQKHKSRSAGLPNKSAAFYAACVLEALVHFHQRDVAFRDLKLENILIDSEGFVRIVDLGFAKMVNEKTYTLVGTPEYIAPEIIMSKGYDKACDLWSYGVLAYELVVGHSPFFGPGTRMDMFKRIVQVKYECPWCVTDNAKDFIKQLLVRRPTDRLGNRARGHSETRSHPWFEETNISFKKIMAMTQEPPWIPPTESLMHLSSFDDFSELEDEPEGKEEPLTDEEQAMFADF